MSKLMAQDIIARITQTGPFDVQFKEKIEEYEAFAESGMRARITAAGERDDCLEIRVDYDRFDAHNRPLAKPNYYDKAGEATLTAYEAGFYTGQDSLYLELNDDLSEHLEIIESITTSLFDEYLAANANGEKSYVQWLEDQVLAQRVSPQ